jgi:hypothetical protein
MLGAAAKRFNFKPSCSSSDIRKVRLTISTTNLLPQAVRKHATDKWALPCTERWLMAQMDATTMRQQFDWRETLF